MRLPLLILFLAFAAWAANVKLYLKDGTYHLVREYQVQADRVRYYSTERSDWEEIPLSLVDIPRTETEAASRRAELEKEAKSLAEEEKAGRDLANEVARIPREPGVYWVEGNQTKAVKQGESAVKTNKGRSILKRISPLPTVPGKATLEMDGAHSGTVFTNPTQEFYFQLSETERFAIIRLTPRGTVRVVEDITIMPGTNEMQEAPDVVPTLQQQLGEDLYKIWPKEPFTPGEYAVIEYTAGKMNMQIWDFAIKSAK